VSSPSADVIGVRSNIADRNNAYAPLSGEDALELIWDPSSIPELVPAVSLSAFVQVAELSVGDFDGLVLFGRTAEGEGSGYGDTEDIGRDESNGCEH